MPLTCYFKLLRPDPCQVKKILETFVPHSIQVTITFSTCYTPTWALGSMCAGAGVRKSVGALASATGAGTKKFIWWPADWGGTNDSDCPALGLPPGLKTSTYDFFISANIRVVSSLLRICYEHNLTSWFLQFEHIRIRLSPFQGWVRFLDPGRWSVLLWSLHRLTSILLLRLLIKVLTVSRRSF